MASKHDPIRLKNYNIIFIENIFKDIVKNLKKLVSAPFYAIITDDNVKNLYGNDLFSILQNNDLNTFIYSIKPAENSKTRKTKARIEDWLLRLGCNRESVLIALGGGVVGDITGFVASTFMRGIRYVQIPTTVLACADSSIGGKTGINVLRAKNIVGTFHPPKAVFVDVNLLKTLPERHFRNGFSEIIKIAAVCDRDFFEFIESFSITSLSSFSEKQKLLDIIYKAIKLKSEIVEKDERESNKRKILNFGHTIGHSIEAVSDQYLHGECVSIGMSYESMIATELGVLKYEDYRRLISLLIEFKLPTRVPLKMLQNIKFSEFENFMRLDKKNKSNKSDYVQIVVLKSIGLVLKG
ncbi:3-dehydroquinate dehydratase (3-dehydroquinase), variant 2 [Bonamia ostreae]|uniref:3-dehydroquinate dehydratase (3-dehydroquinase), variant 2 n=1 Tax=Bonamia ostreae TaxID=126728 RepID=A0ABV2AJW3_9EUKA